MLPVGEPHEMMLSPGDVLYIPRGVMHDAATLPGERSLHVTLGLLETSWAQAIRSLVDDLELSDPVLRESVPTWRIGEADLFAALATRLNEMAKPEHAGRLTNLLLEQLARDRQPLPARGLFAPMPEGALRLAEGMHTHLVQTDDGTSTLFWTGGTLELSPAQTEALAALSEGAEPEDREFAHKLWRIGLLEPG